MHALLQHAASACWHVTYALRFFLPLLTSTAFLLVGPIAGRPASSVAAAPRSKPPVGLDQQSGVCQLPHMRHAAAHAPGAGATAGCSLCSHIARDTAAPGVPGRIWHVERQR